MTVEFCIWLPFLLGVAGFVFDATMVLFAQAQMWHAASEVARAISLGRIEEHQIHAAFGLPESISIDIAREAGNVLHLVMTRPVGQIGTGLFFFSMNDLSVGLVHLVEPDALPSG